MNAAREDVARADDRFDPSAVRAQFPILHQKVRGKPLVYLDNAATTQKPRAVLDVIERYYVEDNSNVHRAAHALSDRATRAFEAARARVAAFLNAPAVEQIIWTRGTTESINLVASSYGGSQLGAGDEIIVSQLEHHSNIVPWQLVAERTGAVLRVIPCNEAGELDLDAYAAMLNERTRIVSIVHVSNALGTVNPVAEMLALARRFGATTLVDGAQCAAHMPVDVQELDCDFYAFSGHKTFGPTGIGVLYGRRELLEAMPPYQGGGEMIETVSFEGSTWNQLPYKFEAGTPHIAGAIGLGAAIEWLQSFDFAAIQRHEQALLDRVADHLGEIDGLRPIGTAAHKAGVFSFLLEGGHPHDVGTLLDQQGVAVRTGHHCTMPLMARLCIPGTVRASFALYNTLEDVDALFTALRKVQSFL